MQLLERQSELETLSRCLQEARAGSGKLILIAGEAGMGKSSLVEQFALEHRREARVLWGACDPLTTPRALAPVREIAAQTIGLGAPGTDEAESRDRLFRVLLDEVSRRAGTASILVLEDLHWADEATLDFLRFMGRRMQRTSALLLATYRDEELFPAHPLRLALGELTGLQVIRLRLAPLSLAAVEMLARESGRDARLLHETTGGNPFFVREVLASPGEPVPETVRDAVLARLARCSGTTRELAELVAISPTRTEAWLVDAVLGICLAIVDEAGARGLLEIQSDSVGFRHQLARLAVLSAIAPERIRAMHIKVLDALRRRGADPARLVHHAVLAADAAAVLENAPLAARQAARLGAHRRQRSEKATAVYSLPWSE